MRSVVISLISLIGVPWCLYLMFFLVAMQCPFVVAVEVWRCLDNNSDVSPGHVFDKSVLYILSRANVRGYTLLGRSSWWFPFFSDFIYNICYVFRGVLFLGCLFCMLMYYIPFILLMLPSNTIFLICRYKLLFLWRLQLCWSLIIDLCI